MHTSPRRPARRLAAALALAPHRPPARRLAATLALAPVLAACGADDGSSAPAPGTYAAQVPGSPAYLAVVLDREQAAGYLCDRGATSAWFAHRPHDDGRADLVSRSGRATVALRPDDGRLHARVRLPGAARPVDVTLARATGEAGLYRVATAADSGIEAGWIVLPDGSRRGSANAGTAATTTAAPPLDTATGTVKWLAPGLGTSAVQKLTAPALVADEAVR
jgi:hypothetical protein